MQVQDLNAVVKALSDSMKNPIELNELTKNWVQSNSPTSGITAYALEAGAKLLYPILTPLRNSTPRVGGGVGTAENWRAVTAIDTTLVSLGVSEGNRGGIVTHTTKDFTQAYKGLGQEDFVTYESTYAGRTFDDVKALGVSSLLQAVMRGEERVLLGGNNSVALGTGATPTLVASTTGGTLATAGAFSVICVPLTFDGILSGSVVGGIRSSITRTNADSSTDTYGGYSGQKSANATVSVTGATGSVGASVPVKNGAMGYAWFWAATAGSEVLGAITTLNSVVITALAAGTQTAASLPSADNSQNALLFDGILSQSFLPGSGSLIQSQPTGVNGTGTPLTSDGAGGIVEWDAILKYMWDNYKLSPDVIWVSSQEQQNVQKKILSAPSTAAQRFVFNVSQNGVVGGSIVVGYFNKFGMPAGGDYAQGSLIAIKLHPDMPAGTILFQTKTLPYKLSGIGNILQVKTRQEYYQIEWAARSRKYEFGVYVDELLQNYAPFAFAILNNIGNG